MSESGNVRGHAHRPHNTAKHLAHFVRSEFSIAVDVDNVEPVRQRNIIGLVFFAHKEINKIFVRHGFGIARVQWPRGVRQHAIDGDSCEAMLAVANQIVPG